MARDHILGSHEQVSPLGQSFDTFEKGDRVRFKGVYAHNGYRTVSHVTGSGPKADVWFEEGDTAWAQHLEKVKKVNTPKWRFR